jgi:hypothetical protein
MARMDNEESRVMMQTPSTISPGLYKRHQVPAWRKNERREKSKIRKQNESKKTRE